MFYGISFVGLTATLLRARLTATLEVAFKFASKSGLFFYPGRLDRLGNYTYNNITVPVSFFVGAPFGN